MAEGGKQKAGGVPEGWQRLPLGHLIDVKHGYAFDSGNFSEEGEKLLLTPGNFSEEGDFKSLRSGNKYYLGDVKSQFILKPGDLLTAMTEQAPGLLGSTICVPENGTYLHNQRLGLLEISDIGALNSSFLRVLMNSPEIRKSISETSSGTKVKHTSPDKIKAVSVNLPPLPEQRKIAAILSTWDDSLANLTDLLAAKRQQKRGLAEALLTGQKRLPGFEGEWEETRFSSVMQESRISAPDELGKRLTVSLHLKGVSVREERDSSEVGKTIYYRRKAGQFIYGKQNIFRGSLGLVPQELDGYLSSQDLPAFDIAPKYDPAFIFAFFARPKFYEGLEKIATGTGSKRVHPETIFKLSYPLPPLPEQQAIASILSTLDGEIASLEALRSKVQEQKRGLMDELLTGRIRVKVNVEDSV
ncbi:restriction endonuclease subunit S [Deinococcus sp. SL84]|uniref:restriction endonuclease subunit S n=1 Tax=Deinococcus sp. SL84 TaxID=2994663 RepID=UPI002273C809|nr:restriction endonuclease subunit S [Deinococcus sp. SL84]MCY1702759.1 restriction endonuclease subunit S [Deinococcus sp. SL84]